MEKDVKRYYDACHAMQSGVAMMMNYPDSHDHEPKHLRVGVNVALSDLGALVKILVDKGIITIDEYEAAIADHMESEAKSYEEKVSARVGGKVTLR